MWEWLEGPGAAFRNPLPGSTNYLGAYDANGRLVRMRNARGKEKDEDNDNKEKNEDDDDGELDDNLSISEEGPVRTAKAMPPEEADDLIPFPSNPNFRSEPVLSDALRDEIYKRVVVDKTSIRRVSVDLGVDMNRVGAVVRLKAVEEKWAQEVCLIFSPSLSPFSTIQ